ncbi:MAG: activator of HSP90 ATPase [Flavobacteriaceae bacterium]|nr:activator of HSP90 ATPase [Flavobacteriaceae bacterium]
MSKTNNENCVVTIERTFDAPINLVWQAWTNPEHIAKWWGPKGMKTRVLEHQFNVGGTWKFAMAMPDGNDFISEGRYLEIDEPKLLRTTADFKPMTEGVELEVHLEQVEHQTKFTFRVIHPTEAYKIQQEKMGIYNGWGSTFDRLQTHVEN